jgi:hypothetical protein
VRGIGVEYPVAIDNHFAISCAFKNQYSPSRYFVDAMGRIRHHHVGAGAYAESELLIQRLLCETGARNISPGVSSRRWALRRGRFIVVRGQEGR